MTLDGAFLSHVLMWTIGAMSLLTAVLTAGAFFVMGRQAYRKD